MNYGDRYNNPRSRVIIPQLIVEDTRPTICKLNGDAVTIGNLVDEVQLLDIFTVMRSKLNDGLFSGGMGPFIILYDVRSTIPGRYGIILWRGVHFSDSL